MKKIFCTLAWIAGICLAGSEGETYINFIGLAVFFFASLVIMKGAQYER